MSDDILTAIEAADFLKVSPSTITRLCQRGELTYFKVGRLIRFRREWLDAYAAPNHGSDDDRDRGHTTHAAIGAARRFPPLRGGRHAQPHGTKEAS